MYQQYTVNHSENFKDFKSEYYTNNIELEWQKIKIKK